MLIQVHENYKLTEKYWVCVVKNVSQEGINGVNSFFAC